MRDQAAQGEIRRKVAERVASVGGGSVLGSALLLAITANSIFAPIAVAVSALIVFGLGTTYAAIFERFSHVRSRRAEIIKAALAENRQETET